RLAVRRVAPAGVGRRAGARRDGAGAERHRADARVVAGRELVSDSKEKMRTDNLRAWFGGSEALKGITLPIASGRVTAVIGPSGCGKSTLVRCLNRMHEVLPGT